MSPLLWGTEERLRQLFGDGVADLHTERLTSRQTFYSAEHWIEFFRTYFGPTKVAFERVGSEGEAALEADLREFLEDANVAGERALVLEAEYPRSSRREPERPSPEALEPAPAAPLR
jgi:hypothetical protein